MRRLIPLVVASTLLWGCSNNATESESAIDTTDESTFQSPLDPDKPRTIVLICEDALRRDMLPIYGNEVIRTPNLDRITENAVVFDNAYSPSSWTKPTFASIFTGQPFTQHGAVMAESTMNSELPTLAEILDNAGWKTMIITANPHTGKTYGVSRGFGEIVELNGEEDENGITKVHAEDFLPRLDELINEQSDGEDLFCVVHLMDTHGPYYPPEDYRYMFKDDLSVIKSHFKSNNTDEFKRFYNNYHGQAEHILSSGAKSTNHLVYDVENILNDRARLYCASLTYFDDVLPDILNRFDINDRMENAIVFFFSDHGEEFLDHQCLGHFRGLYQELIHTALIVWGRGIERARLQELVSARDFMPTILELADISLPTDIAGKSFAPMLFDRPYTERAFCYSSPVMTGKPHIAVIGATWKLILANDYELYNLSDDYKEQHNLAADNPMRLGYMRSKLKEWWHDIHCHGTVKTVAADLDDETVEILKGLGYIQ